MTSDDFTSVAPQRPRCRMSRESRRAAYADAAMPASASRPAVEGNASTESRSMAPGTPNQGGGAAARAYCFTSLFVAESGKEQQLRPRHDDHEGGDIHEVKRGEHARASRCQAADTPIPSANKRRLNLAEVQL